MLERIQLCITHRYACKHTACNLGMNIMRNYCYHLRPSPSLSVGYRNYKAGVRGLLFRTDRALQHDEQHSQQEIQVCKWQWVERRSLSPRSDHCLVPFGTVGFYYQESCITIWKQNLLKNLTGTLEMQLYSEHMNPLPVLEIVEEMFAMTITGNFREKDHYQET